MKSMVGRLTRRRLLKSTVALSTLNRSADRASATTTTPRSQSADGWQQFCYDAANSGYAPTQSGPTTGIKEQYHVRLGNSIHSSPTIANGTLYVGSTDDHIYALAADDGTEQWRFQIGANVESPAVVNGTVYVGSAKGILYALDADTGAKQWQFRTNGSVFEGAPTVVDDTVYVGSSGGHVFALAATDGSERWRFRGGGRVDVVPAVVDDTVYFGGWNGTVYALAVSDGAKQWEFSAGKRIATSPAVVDDTVYVGSTDGRLYALAGRDGAERWRFQTDRAIFSSPAIVDGTVYVGSNDTQVYALATQDGTERWRFQTGGKVVSSPAVVDDTVYVGSSDGHVYGLKTENGSERWRFRTDGSVSSSPAVVDGTIYIGSDDGHLYGLQNGPKTVGSAGIRLPGVGLHVWPWQVGAGFGAFTGVSLAWRWLSRGASAAEARTSESSSTDLSTPPSQEPVTDDRPNSEATDPDSSGDSRASVTEGHASEPSQPDPPEMLQQRYVALQDQLTEPTLRITDTPEDSVQELTTLQDQFGELADEATTQNSAEIRAYSSEFAAILESLAEAASELSTARNYRERARNPHSQDKYESALDAYERALDFVDTAHARANEISADSIQTTIGGDRASIRDEQEALRTEQMLLAEFDDVRTRIEAAVAVAEHLDWMCKQHAATTGPSERSSLRGPPETIPEPPTLSLSYETLERGDRIGRGGNADVYEATVTKDGQKHELAVKEPRFEGTLHGETVERFLDEADTWSKLDDHPHIVTVVDWDPDPMPWIAMEYMDAGDLRARIDEEDMDLREAVWVARSVTDAVIHARDRGIAHLDLKPANILFTSTGGDAWDVPKVGDWGLAKLLLDHSKSLEGLTVQYAAPEQVKEGADVGHHTDIYQMGVVFYELFVGEPPFSGAPAAVVDQITTETPTPPTEVAPELPATLDEILLTALAKAPADRYDHPVYLQDALQDLYENL